MPIESLLNDFFHYRDIPDISEQAVHLNDIFQCKSDEREPFFHFIESAVYLFFDGAADISDTVVKEAVISGFDYTGMSPVLINIVSFDIAHTFPFTHRVRC